VKSLLWFFVLACLVTWPLALLVERSLVFGLIGLFGPVFAAFASSGQGRFTGGFRPGRISSR
jgi:hypothetical protein